LRCVNTTPSNTGNKKKDSFYKKKVTYRTFKGVMIDLSVCFLK